MPGLVSRVDTSRVPREERLQFWSQALTGLNRAVPGGLDAFQVDGYHADSIDGHLEKTDVGGLSVCRIEIGGGRVTQRSADHGRGLSVLLQLVGISVFEQDGRRIEVSAGDCLVGDISQTRRMLSPTVTKHLLVLIPLEMALSYGLQPRNISYQCFSNSRGLGRLNRSLVETLIDDREAIAADHEHYLADMVMRSLQLSLAESGRRVGLGARERLVQRAKSFIDKNLRDPDLDLAKVAEALDCSKRYLHAAFAEEGGTITKYIWSARLELCRRELARTSRDEKLITDIAFSCGFNSSSHFSRTFKEKFGVPPSKIRR